MHLPPSKQKTLAPQWPRSRPPGDARSRNP
jgi:hypothetical protein